MRIEIRYSCGVSPVLPASEEHQVPSLADLTECSVGQPRRVLRKRSVDGFGGEVPITSAHHCVDPGCEVGGDAVRKEGD